MRTSPGLPLRRAAAGRSAPATFPAGNSPFGRPSSAKYPLLPDAGAPDPGKEIRGGGDQLAFRIVSQRDAAWVGALFAAVDAKQ
ncbi:hypothetical protein AB0F46_16910 [Streptomyces sp. NPDC026665]|uniref:hypothetical protein n=1 Tax=Streptomyces sp. NPDC026665 TaxID=3154798 RepID=UPI00340EC174